jgi:hypothetical protein
MYLILVHTQTDSRRCSRKHSRILPLLQIEAEESPPQKMLAILIVIACPSHQGDLSNNKNSRHGILLGTFYF